MTNKQTTLAWLEDCAKDYENCLTDEERKNKKTVKQMKDNIYRAAIREIKHLQREVERMDLHMLGLVQKNLKLLQLLRAQAKMSDKREEKVNELQADIKHLEAWSKVDNCLIQPRDADVPIFAKHGNIITANLDGYAIIPKEQYGGYHEVAVADAGVGLCRDEDAGSPVLPQEISHE